MGKIKLSLGEPELFFCKQTRCQKEHGQFVSTVAAILAVSRLYQLTSYLIS